MRCCETNEEWDELISKILLENYNFDISAIDDSGRSALHFAVGEGHRQKRDGRNCLHIAASNGHLRLCKLLLENYNFDLQMTDDDGWSALHLAVRGTSAVRMGI